MPKKKTAKKSKVFDLHEVSSVSKVSAAVLFVILPFVGFYLGMLYMQMSLLN